jgi:hypothetical protein
MPHAQTCSHDRRIIRVSFLRRTRLRLGSLIYDVPRFELQLLGVIRETEPSWLAIRHRGEEVTIAPDRRGVRCDWELGSDLHVTSIFPSTGRRLMQRALRDAPIAMRDAPPAASAPLVSFIVGHRGLARLPNLLATLRTIAAQDEVPVECIVVEQSLRPEIRDALPSWVRYVHTPLPRPDVPYVRSWTLNVGARLAHGETLVLHDNDMLVPRRYAADAVARVQRGAAVVDLKRFTFYLTPAATSRVFAGEPIRCEVESITQNVHGASLVTTREAYFALGGFDEHFIGWGGEDNDFWDRARAAVNVDAFGSLPFVHLHHAPQPGKLGGNEAPAVKRYWSLRSVPPLDRIETLRKRDFGRIDTLDE